MTARGYGLIGFSFNLFSIAYRFAKVFIVINIDPSPPHTINKSVLSKSNVSMKSKKNITEELVNVSNGIFLSVNYLIIS